MNISTLAKRVLISSHILFFVSAWVKASADPGRERTAAGFASADGAVPPGVYRPE